MKILEKLYEERIFSFKVYERCVVAFELCDEYFKCDLSKDELLQLSKEIKELANSLKGD